MCVHVKKRQNEYHRLSFSKNVAQFIEEKKKHSDEIKRIIEKHKAEKKQKGQSAATEIVVAAPPDARGAPNFSYFNTQNVFTVMLMTPNCTYE